MSLAKLRELIIKPKATSFITGTVVAVISTTQVAVKTVNGVVECSTNFPLIVGDQVRLQDRVVIGKILNNESSIPVFRV
jgi:hypothetical protein